MPLAWEIGLAVVVGPALWLAGAIFFDFVHWVLHRMLSSRRALLRALAWPHAVHHEWIDRNLEVCWENQTRNVWCHIVPEYVTQLAFAAALAWLLPAPFVVVLVALQTLVFAGILRARGLDANHRPIEWLDAYRPGFATPPAYHALHHVYPDAYFSAYTKAIDWLVGGGTQLAGRRFAFSGGDTLFARALAEELRRAGGVGFAELAPEDDEALRAVDVQVLCDPEQPVAPAVERFIEATRERRLPPEVWAVHERPDDPVARGYHRDVRVNYRTLLVPAAERRDPLAAARAAATAVSRIRRGFNLVSSGPLPRAVAAWWRFRRAAPETGPRVRSRTELCLRTRAAEASG